MRTCKDCERYPSCSSEVEGLDTEAVDCHLYKRRLPCFGCKHLVWCEPSTMMMNTEEHPCEDFEE